MAKYSTGSGGGGDSEGTCELCGSPSDSLRDASIAGASLSVCRDCAPHDDRGPEHAPEETGSESDRPDPGRRAAQKTAELADAAKADPDYWVEHGTNYEEDRLPYLVTGYGDTLQDARQSAGLTIEELAEECEVSVEDVEAVEQNRASRAGVGGSVVRKLEERLDIDLVESV